MRRFVVIWMLASTILACSREGGEPGQWPLSREELDQASTPALPGESTYRRYCIGCHGADGRANGGLTGADFVSQQTELSAKPDSELAAAVRDGKRGERAVMPAHKPVLSEAQIHEVIGYVRQRFLRAPALSP